jgi:flagellar protein FlaJ
MSLSEVKRFHYLYQQTDNMFKKMATDVKAVSENLSMLMETFIIVSVLGALSFYMFFVISLSIGQGVGMGMSTESFFLFAFIILPMLSGVFLYLSDGAQSNFPCPNTKTYMTFGASIPIGILLAMVTIIPFFVPTQFPIPRFAVPLWIF